VADTAQIGCDRASPCSNCASARLDCTYSTVAHLDAIVRLGVNSSSSLPFPSEQKLNDVARDIGDIKHLLQKIDLSSNGYQAIAESPATPEGERPAHGTIPLRDHSALVIEFVKAVVDGVPIQSDSNEVTASLKSLIRSVELPDSSERLPLGQGRHQITMPQLDHVVRLIRWAKGMRF
jgi:hypothetical protein